MQPGVLSSVSSEGVATLSEEAPGLSQRGWKAMAGLCSHRLRGKCIGRDSGQNEINQEQQVTYFKG